MSPSIAFASETTTSQRRSSIYSQPKKSDAVMTISQKYFLAHQARGKLQKAASKADHDLRVLCGHANLLDNLMIDLANAEQAQEQWFNKSQSGSRQEKAAVQHQDAIMEESEADWEAEEAQNEEDDSSDEEDFISIRDEDMESDEDEFETSLALTRTASRPIQSSPPELTHEEDSDSEDDHMPPSPPNVAVETLSAKQASAIDASTFFPSQKPAALESQNFFLSTRQQPTIIAAY